MDRTNYNHLWSKLVIDELIRNGIDYFCISPGSRSTPLAVAAARHPKAVRIVCHDERGAAFHGLGYARARGKAAVLICTSGTAAANCYPAVIEAAMDRVPLLVLSADRPPELQQTGTNQTIQQDHLYGRYAKWFFEIPCPSEAISARMLLTTIDQAIHQTQVCPAGPVHLNLMFREPLEPSGEGIHESYCEDLMHWTKASEPLTRYGASARLPEPEAIQRIGEILTATDKGIIAVGRLHGDAEQEAVLALINALRWPAFVDVLSGLRLGRRDEPIIHYFDQLLLAKSFRERHRPETILHIGGELTSKRYMQFIEAFRPANHVVIKDHPLRNDPLHNVSFRLDADMRATCLALIEDMAGSRAGQGPAPGEWLTIPVSQSRQVHEIISSYVLSEPSISEIGVAFLVSQNIPREYGLWLASSMPVRDMDMYASYQSHPVRVDANRGASGIDGTIASAVGYAAGLAGPLTLIIGDTSFLHDLNSLYQVAHSRFPVVMVVINNDGGGIFSFLPIAQSQDVFEDYFAAPHGLGFEYAARMFGIAYCAPETHAEFVEAYRRSLVARQSVIIEVFTDRRKNFQLHQKLQQIIVSELEDPQ